jgi:hypothetical protein
MSKNTHNKPKILSLMPFKAVEVEYLNDFKTRFIIEVDLHNQLDRVYPLRPKIGAECLKS